MPSIQLVANEHVDRSRPYGGDQRRVLSLAAVAEAMAEIRCWPGYALTPLVRLRGLANDLSVSEVAYKDEATRFGLGSFKALGGAYGVLRVLSEQVKRIKGRPATSAQLLRRDHADIVASCTVSCASDGNHGKSVAWGASLFGCRAAIYLPRHVSHAREDAIAQYGARTIRVGGTYDDAVRRAQADAPGNGWIVVSDTSYPGYEDIPRTVMQGYAIMMMEALVQMNRPPTHVFVQAGVGGLAAAIAAYFWELYGADRPVLVLCEPEGAACLFESIRTGILTPFPGELRTLMGCLACAEPSPLAWRILEHAADFAATVPDDLAVRGMRLLSDGVGGDQPIVAGESAVAGLMAAREASRDRGLRETLGITDEARVLVIGTEGATDPEAYTQIVGRRPKDITSAGSLAT